jgi:hypothetical protein
MSPVFGSRWKPACDTFGTPVRPQRPLEPSDRRPECPAGVLAVELRNVHSDIAVGPTRAGVLVQVQPVLEFFVGTPRSAPATLDPSMGTARGRGWFGGRKLGAQLRHSHLDRPPALPLGIDPRLLVDKELIRSPGKQRYVLRENPAEAVRAPR